MVDEIALASALRSGTIAGAALDVFSIEPLGPEPASRFEGLDNLVLTPHVAGNTRESVDRVAEVTVANVLEVLAAAPPELTSAVPEVGVLRLAPPTPLPRPV